MGKKTGRPRGRPAGSKNRPGQLGAAFTKERKEAYCRELKEHGEPALARERVGVSHTTVNRHRLQDAEFRDAEQRAVDEYRASVHKEIHRRGIEGWDEPVYQNGVQVGTKRRYSDALLLAHAKRHSPDLYGDRMKIDQTTKVEGDLLGLSLEQLSPKSRQLLRKIIEIESDGQEDE